MNPYLLFYLLVLLSTCATCDSFLVKNIGHGSSISGLKLNPQLCASNELHASVDGNNNGLGYTLKERNPYDVHVYYDTDEKEKEALQLRESMKERFTWMRFYNPKGRPIGPHPVPMWEADFGSYENRGKLNEIREFLAKEHQSLSILIHPHSTDSDYADHTEHAIWFGEKQDLKIQGWQRN